MRRKPAVAGQFYHGTSAKLSHQVQQYITKNLPKEHALGILSPHAGLIYSGAVAGEVYSRIALPETFILLGPNHTGLGARMAIMSEGEWEIPTGIFQIDEKLGRRILANAPLVSSDTQAHMFEHSLEVQLPFIAHFSRNSKIVPLTVMSATLEECRSVGEGIAKSIKETDYPVVIVASSDMSHYVSDEVAHKKDKMAIDKILSLDPEGLFSVVRKEQISMCGYLPATMMLFAAKSLGARGAKLIKYATSGDVSGDYDAVVGYAGVIVS
ncbi:MAG: AmmeMemoRadiSam system protein B [Nitrospirae bacterium]|nr:AmmeMemoRadiSam system protein B [Nitrospirota bacterium]MCL5422690.1 AmmeMemoRadiSam system protein B [Nitrospirota bacterium]